MPPTTSTTTTNTSPDGTTTSTTTGGTGGDTGGGDGDGSCDGVDCGDDFVLPAPGAPASWWESRYPEGMSGAITGFINQRSSSGPISKFTGSWGFADSGTIPDFSLNLTIGPYNFGNHSFQVPVIIWAFLRTCILLTALFTARSLIFGG